MKDFGRGDSKKQIKIEINTEQVKNQLLHPDHRESMSLLFYDFNNGARNTEPKESAYQDTDINVERGLAAARRPITSHFGGKADRLPSRQVKTRNRKRISLASRKHRKEVVNL